MKSLRTQTLLLILLLTAGCEPDYIPDPVDPRLPEFTEEGNNEAGAFINDDVWRSVESLHGDATQNLLTVFYTDADAIDLKFEGGSRVFDAIIFHLSGLGIQNEMDLLPLQGRKIVLGNDGNTGVCFSTYCDPDDPACRVTPGTGQLFFKTVKFDKKYAEVVIAGTFGFTFEDASGNPGKVTFGRFDYRINQIGTIP